MVQLISVSQWRFKTCKKYYVFIALSFTSSQITHRFTFDLSASLRPMSPWSCWIHTCPHNPLSRQNVKYSRNLIYWKQQALFQMVTYQLLPQYQQVKTTSFSHADQSCFQLTLLWNVISYFSCCFLANSLKCFQRFTHYTHYKLLG